MIPYNKDFWRWLFSAIGTSRTLHPGTQRKFWAMENSVAEVASGCEMHALDNIKIADASMANFQKVVLDKDVTVGMSAYGNYSTTLAALRSLFHSAEGDFELILVDDNSPDNVRSLFMQAKKEHPNTKILGFGENIEYSGSLNAILSHAQGKWALFLSNDIFVTPSYLREIFATAKMHPDFGIVRGCSNFVDNGLSSHNIEFLGGFKSYEQVFEFAQGIAARHHEQVYF